jgi:hypothetical protein
MSSVVKADDVAIQASKTFLNIIDNQLQGAFQQLSQAGTTLSDPNHWAGGDATQFQTQIWPKAQSDIKQMQTSLTDLQQQVNKVLSNIFAAGGN